ncbi:MAG TPA: trigger factor [Cyclobacteriaceae bacterium]|nr:trigger factor [Cyclobacteriaceae bacterium]
MNITLDKQNTTDGVIKINLTEGDYLPKVDQKLKELSRKATIKGFRQGKIPTGVIKKMYGKSVLVEEVNQLLSHSVSDYIRSNNIKILGDPLPNQEKALTIDWDSQKDFEFEFQIGLVDDFKIDLSSKVKVKSHPIEVDDKTMEETLTDLKTRFGETTTPEVSEATDNLFGEIVAVDGVRSASEEKRSSYISIEKVVKAEQKKFIGLKKEDEVEFDIAKILKEENLIAQAINVSAEEAKGAKGKYTLKISTISRIAPAAIDQELFDKTFGKDIVKSEEEFMNKIKETIGENYKRETDHLLDHEIQHHFVDHTEITMPDNFLKTWLKNTSQGQVTDEVLGKEFNAYKETLKWDLIKNKIAEDNKITVEATEVKDKAKAMIIEQFGGPAIAGQLGTQLDAIADNYLSGQDGKGQNFMQLYNQLRAEKIMKVIKENITVQEKKVTLDEFKKIADEHKH